MTKKDLMKVLKNMPDNTEVIIRNIANIFYSFEEPTVIAVEKRARVPKIVLGFYSPRDRIKKIELLKKSKTVWKKYLEEKDVNLQ